MKNYRKNDKQLTQKGQGMVEFAIIIGVMIGLFIGIFEIMTIFNKRTDLATATRLAARQASESWVPDGTTDITSQIEQYMQAEMVKMGYADTLITDGDLTVEIIAHEYNQSTSELVAGTDRVCTYGEYISVRAQLNYSPEILPLDTFFEGASSGIGTLEEEFAYRCVRGQ